MSSKDIVFYHYFLSSKPYKQIRKVPTHYLLHALSLILLIFLTSFVTHAEESVNHQKNYSITSSDDIVNGMKEIGRAKLTKFFFDIYQSRLLTPSGNYNKNFAPLKLIEEGLGNQDFHNTRHYSPIAFEITYLRNIRSEFLVNETIKQWQHLQINENSYQQYIQTLSDLWPDINKGDILLLYISGNTSVFYLNNEYLGEINNINFGTLFLSIWLSENTAEPKLRKQLLSL